MIRYKLIEDERKAEAPFIGALLSAISCPYNCKGCFNQELKTLPTRKATAAEIIEQVMSNPFNQGIILGGLEWTAQPNELRELISAAIIMQIPIMLYTHMTEEEFIVHFPELVHSQLWVKFGAYEEALRTETNVQYGVKLASSNQYIKQLK